MHVVAEGRAPEFLARIGPYLEAAPVESNLIFGVVASIEPARGKDPPLLLRVERDGAIELVAVQTPPRPLVLGPGNEAPVLRLVEYLAFSRVALPGVIGPRDAVDAFIGAWFERTGASAGLVRLQTLYELEQLEMPPAVAGCLREARAEDEDRLAAWSSAFQAEVGVFVGASGDTRPFVRGKLQARQLFVWENGGLVSMAGWAARTPRAARVNYVYTPPDERRKGYASACVAALTKKLLDEGSEKCLLFADAGNPTSNGVYRRLGYRPVCDCAEYEF
jgi:GNAT superfamily N-acetyltransferase